MISFLCPGCGQPYTVDSSKAGKRTTCLRCRRPLRVPPADAVHPPPEPVAPPVVSTPPAPPAPAEPPTGLPPVVEPARPAASPAHRDRRHLIAGGVALGVVLVGGVWLFALAVGIGPSRPPAAPVPASPAGPATKSPVRDVYQEAVDSFPEFAEKVVQAVKDRLRGRKFTHLSGNFTLTYEVHIGRHRVDVVRTNSLLYPVRGTIFMDGYADGEMIGLPIVGETVTVPVACSYRGGKWQLDEDAGTIGGRFGHP